MNPRVLLVIGVVVLVLGGLIAWAAATPVSQAPHHWPFDELHDVFEWPISHLQHWSIPLPNWFESKAGPDEHGHPRKSIHGVYDKVIIFSGISKFMVLELIAAGLVALVYVRLAKRIQSGAPPTGAWDNFFEGILTFIRDDVAKPNI